MVNTNSVDDDLQCQALIWNHMLALLDTKVLKCALKLNLFDAVHGDAGNPISLPELAASIPVPQDRIPILRRLLRYLAHMRLVHVHQGETYTLTAAASTYLRDGSEKSHAAFARYFIQEDMIQALHGLDTLLVGGDDGGGSSSVPKERGDDLFGWAAMDPSLNKRLNEGMASTASPIIEAVLTGCPEVFQGTSVLADVGGGYGVAAAAIAKAFPGVRCIVYDLEHVVNEAPKLELVEYEAGDMFVSVPRADVLILMRVMHLCDDKRAVQILKRCKEAIITQGKGKVIIIETMLVENDVEELYRIKLGYDILTMAYFGGKERTEGEWRSLLLEAGFTNCNIKSVRALQHVIEASP